MQFTGVLFGGDGQFRLLAACCKPMTWQMIHQNVCVCFGSC